MSQSADNALEGSGVSAGSVEPSRAGYVELLRESIACSRSIRGPGAAWLVRNVGLLRYPARKPG